MSGTVAGTNTVTHAVSSAASSAASDSLASLPNQAASSDGPAQSATQITTNSDTIASSAPVSDSPSLHSAAPQPSSTVSPISSGLVVTSASRQLQSSSTLVRILSAPPSPSPAPTSLVLTAVNLFLLGTNQPTSTAISVTAAPIPSRLSSISTSSSLPDSSVSVSPSALSGPAFESSQAQGRTGTTSTFHVLSSKAGSQTQLDDTPTALPFGAIAGIALSIMLGIAISVWICKRFLLPTSQDFKRRRFARNSLYFEEEGGQPWNWLSAPGTANTLNTALSFGSDPTPPRGAIGLLSLVGSQRKTITSTHAATMPLLDSDSESVAIFAANAAFVEEVVPRMIQTLPRKLTSTSIVSPSRGGYSGVTLVPPFPLVVESQASLPRQKHSVPSHPSAFPSIFE
ncbi:hypothetical protein BC830DRAFT_1164739 [Chytriomyces sp. MP71]|nr:hypothetical protein BC830DRAFT_1164739 [Chytriomyces sp. MP71]